MKEKLFQFIWQHQYFNSGNLSTTSGEPLEVIDPGLLNHNQGPDFTNARVRINDTLWAGNIELHINSADWDAHRHSSDTNYNNVVLHVVWKHDKEVTDGVGSVLHTLELYDRVSSIMLSHYDHLMANSAFIPCDKQLASVREITLHAWKQRLVVERLEQKCRTIFHRLEESGNHWEEVFWWSIARNFGVKLNAEPFELVARSLPVAMLAKHKHQQLQLEALLLGQAGLLDDNFVEEYPLLLQKEYRFLVKKYNLTPPAAVLYFHRMRPANFPTVRLAQLAALVHGSVHLFSKIIEHTGLNAVRQLLDVTANDYWHYHYRFDQPGDYKVKNLGATMIDNILINTVIPMVFAYGSYHKDQALKDRALNWLEDIEQESNHITKGFAALGATATNAADSQAFVQLKTAYCDKKRCLECSVGNAIIKGVVRNREVSEQSRTAE
jgi:hypothetical protein